MSSLQVLPCPAGQKSAFRHTGCGGGSPQEMFLDMHRARLGELLNAAFSLRAAKLEEILRGRCEQDEPLVNPVAS